MWQFFWRYFCAGGRDAKKRIHVFRCFCREQGRLEKVDTFFFFSTRSSCTGRAVSHLRRGGVEGCFLGGAAGGAKRTKQSTHRPEHLSLAQVEVGKPRESSTRISNAPNGESSRNRGLTCYHYLVPVLYWCQVYGQRFAHRTDHRLSLDLDLPARADLFLICMIYDLYDLARVAGWEPYHLHGL